MFIKHPNETEPFKMWSTKTHGFLSLPLSSFGVLLNLLIITIFFQNSMRSLTNSILLGISIFDLLMMLTYVPYSIYFYLIRTPDPYPDQSVFWPYFLIFYNHLSLFSHACSVWFTCFLAWYRFITVASCVLHKNIMSTYSVKKSMILIVLMVFLFMTFNFLTYDVLFISKRFLYILNLNNKKTAPDLSNEEIKIISKCIKTNTTCKLDVEEFKLNKNVNCVSLNGTVIVKSLEVNVLWVSESYLAIKYPFITSINFWVHAIIFRTLPCILMLIFSILLINLMYKANLNKKRLKQQSEKNSEPDRNNEFNRTTTMLLIIIILFFIMEFPHGILYIICGFSIKFFYEVYSYLADLLDLLVLMNSSVNFFLYCFMSSEFRKKFRQTFFCQNEYVKTVQNVNEIEAGSNVRKKRSRYV